MTAAADPAVPKAIQPPAPRGRKSARTAGDAVAAQLAELADEETPLGPDLAVSEMKYRRLSHPRLFVQGGTVRLVTRNGHDWTRRLPRMAESVAPASACATRILDGEMVALDDGRPVGFLDCCRRRCPKGGTRRPVPITCSTCCIWMVGICGLAACWTRKELLRGLADWKGSVRYSDHMQGQASAALHDQACAPQAWKASSASGADAPYRAGRSRAWVKVKCQGREEFVVLGWTPPQRQPHRNRLAASRLLRRSRRAHGITPARSAPGFPTRVLSGFARAIWMRWRPQAPEAALHLARRTKPDRDHSLGTAGARWPRCGSCRLDRRRPHSPFQLPGAARG